MNDDTKRHCTECELVSGARHARGITPIARGPFVLHPRMEEGAVPGWWIVAPSRHVEQIDALEPGELWALGPVIAELAGQLRRATPCEKVYVSIFAEVLHHLHVHVIARPPDAPPEIRGPLVFTATHVADPRDIDDVAVKVAARLSGTASK
jgi:diadenosine tetraphosphate (Ap4A) HIT family hydrolase